MKSKEELKQLKDEYKVLQEKLQELSEEELKEVVGGFVIPEEKKDYEIHIYSSDPLVNEEKFQEKFQKK